MILRGKFGRFAHDKIFIVSNDTGALKVLTGSTNFSVTGLYVNSNHLLVFTDKRVAAEYANVFEAAVQSKVGTAFNKSPIAAATFSVVSKATPQTEITFSPHQPAFAAQILDGIAIRVQQEGKKKTGGSVLFAVMELKTGPGPVLPALNQVHADENIFSYGISDNPDGIVLYTPGKKTGVLVTGKPGPSQL